jgi:hypothetical protein
LDFHEILYLNIFRNAIEKKHASLKSDKLKAILHKDIRTHIIISRWIFFRIINISDKLLEKIRSQNWVQ